MLFLKLVAPSLLRTVVIALSLSACSPASPPRAHGGSRGAAASRVSLPDSGGLGTPTARLADTSDGGDDDEMIIIVDEDGPSGGALGEAAPGEGGRASTEDGAGSWLVTAPLIVREHPRRDALALGVMGVGTRLPRARRVRAADCVPGWIPVAPRGFVCARLRDSARAPESSALPRLAAGARLPTVYGRVRSDASVFASADAVQRGVGQPVATSLTVERRGLLQLGGQKYWRTRHGLIAERSIRRLRGSRFTGQPLDEDTSLPVAWTLAGVDRQSVAVHDAPSRRARVAGRLPPRTALVGVEQSEDGRFVHVPDHGWLQRDDVRIAERAPMPPGVEAQERWIDIDLDQQTLVAYVGPDPVFATLVSTGKVRYRTPTGVFRIERKVALRTMNSRPGAREAYAVDKVPWTAYFAKGLALHTAYWHQGFGRPRSHGCINLSPGDARRLYAWTGPAVAPGWSEVYGHAGQPGTAIRIRSARDPEPRLRGYAADLEIAAAVDAHG